GQILKGLWLQSLRRILNEVMQAFVSWSALERVCDRRAGPPTPGQIDNAWSISLTEPRCGIELETDDIIGRMAGRVNHRVPPFRIAPYVVLSIFIATSLLDPRPNKRQ